VSGSLHSPSLVDSLGFGRDDRDQWQFRNQAVISLIFMSPRNVAAVRFDNFGNARSLTPTRKLRPFTPKPGVNGSPKTLARLRGFGMTSL